MIKRRVRKEIDKAIKGIWLTDIRQDYESGLFLVEAGIQCSFYHHLRRRLEPLLAENSLYIYPEFFVKELNRKADLVICEMDMSLEVYHLRDCWTDTAAVVELKYGGSDQYLKSDFPKLKAYMDVFGRECQYYFGSIDTRAGQKRLPWLDKRSTANWAGGCVTELNAGWLEDDELYFEVNSYNGMNLQHKQIRGDCIWL